MLHEIDESTNRALVGNPSVYKLGFIIRFQGFMAIPVMLPVMILPI
jgi:hypothetical protein